MRTSSRVILFQRAPSSMIIWRLLTKLAKSPFKSNEISYVERAIYKYVKDLFEGIRVLRQRKYLAYSISTFLLALISTCILIVNGIKPDIIPQDYVKLLLIVEVIFALTTIISAFAFAHLLNRAHLLVYLGTLFIGWIVAMIVYFDYLTIDRLFLIARGAFWIWMVFLSLSFLGFIRSFFTEWYGAIVWAGNPEGRILFSPVIRFSIIVSLILPIYAAYQAISDPIWIVVSVSAAISLILVLTAVFIIPKREKGNVFGTIFAVFYLYSLYHGVTSFIQDVNSPLLILDTFILFFGAVYSVQASSNRATKFKIPLLKGIREERWILITLSLGLGYHATSIYTTIQENPSNIISSFHMGSFIICSLIMLIILLSFIISNRFRAWIVTMQTTSGAMKEILGLFGPDAVKMVLSTLLGASRDKVGDVARVVPDSMQNIGRKLFEWVAEKALKDKEE